MLALATAGGTWAEFTDTPVAELIRVKVRRTGETKPTPGTPPTAFATSGLNGRTPTPSPTTPPTARSSPSSCVRITTITEMLLYLPGLRKTAGR